MMPFKCPYCNSNRIDVDSDVAVPIGAGPDEKFVDRVVCEDCQGVFYTEQ